MTAKSRKRKIARARAHQKQRQQQNTPDTFTENDMDVLNALDRLPVLPSREEIGSIQPRDEPVRTRAKCLVCDRSQKLTSKGGFGKHDNQPGEVCLGVGLLPVPTP